jgi:hypothetical protein
VIAVLHVLNASGHLTLTWNPADSVDVARARKEVEDLRAAGYSFFAVEGATGIDEIEKGKGHLVVKKVEQIFAPLPVESPAGEVVQLPPPKKRGRPKGVPNKPKIAPTPAGPTHVAVRAMAGG